jgi:hypothetical protein
LYLLCKRSVSEENNNDREKIFWYLCSHFIVDIW